MSWVLDAAAFIWKANTFLRGLNVMSKQSFPAQLEVLCGGWGFFCFYLFVFFFLFKYSNYRVLILVIWLLQPTGRPSWGRQKEACRSSQADCQTSFERINLLPKGHTDFWLVVGRTAIYAQRRTFSNLLCTKLLSFCGHLLTKPSKPLCGHRLEKARVSSALWPFTVEVQVFLKVTLYLLKC